MARRPSSAAVLPCLAVLATLAALLASACAASAAPTWMLPATALTDGDTPTNPPAVAMDPAGDAVVVWATDTAVKARTRPAGGTWGTTATLGTGVAMMAPSAAMDDAGDVTVLWGADDGAAFRPQVAQRPAGATAWSAPQTLSPSIGSMNDRGAVGVSASGQAVAVWTEFDTGASRVVVRSATRTAGAWGAAASLSDATDVSEDGNPQLVVDPDGAARAAWVAWSASDSDYHVQQAHLSGATWSAAQDVSSSSDYLQDLRLADDGAGSATLAWIRSSGPPAVQVATGPGGGWSVGDLSTDLQPACTPRLALSAGGMGGATVLWTRQSTGGLTAATRSAGAWGVPAAVADPSASEAVVDASLVSDPAGETVAAYTAYDAVVGMFHMRAARVDGSGWAAPVELGQEEGSGSVPALATDTSGDVLAAWSGNDGTLAHGDVSAAGLQAGGPRLGAVTLPATATTGVPATFGATPISVFASVVSTAWDFGDGTTATGTAATHAYAAAGTPTATLTATDSAGNVSTARQSVDVRDPQGGGPATPATPIAVPRIVRATSTPAGDVAVLVEIPRPGTLDGTATHDEPARGFAAVLRPGPGRFAYATGTARSTVAGRIVLHLRRTARSRSARVRLRVLRLRIAVHFRPAGGGEPAIRLRTLTVRVPRRGRAVAGSDAAGSDAAGSRRPVAKQAC